MAAYVPADALLYLEANSLPDVASGLSQTEGWRVLSGPVGLRPGLGNVGWLGRLAEWTGVGPADAIVFARMQIAAVVLGVAAADGGETLNVKPRVALVVETHSSERRTLAAIEKHVGNFALRAYSNPRVEKKEADGAHWIVWSSVSNERRILTAVTGSVAVIGNDEAAVRACLAVRRGERPSLAGSHELAEARRRVVKNDSLAFGFMSSQGAANLSEVVAAIYAGQISEDTAWQSLAANLLPQIARKILGSIGWSPRLVSGRIEDSYFISTNNDAAARLRVALVTSTSNSLASAGFLPAECYSLTRYTTRDPLTAWRGLSFSITSQLDPVLAVMAPRFLNAALTPYGIEEPESFLQAIGPEIVTARLANGGNSTIVIVEVRDEMTLRALVSKRMGTNNPKVEMVGDAELIVSTDQKRGAASFIGGYLLMGNRESVRRCLSARQQEQSLNNSKDFQTLLGTTSLMGPSHVLTFTQDSIPARRFIAFIADQPAARSKEPNTQDLDMKAGNLPYAASEMHFVEGGIERRTWSTFGLLGLLTTQFDTRN